MKVAVAWNHPSRLLDCSFRFEQYAAGLRALGHEPVLVATRASGEGFAGPLHLADDEASLRSVSFWREVGADAAILVTWHRMSDLLAAIREAGTRVVSIADSDGRIGTLRHPRYRLERLLVACDGWAARGRAVRFWLGEVLREAGGRGAEVREALESTRLSDVVALGNEEGVERFRRFLARHGAAELDGRVVEVPWTIGASFLACAVPERKEDLIVAVGRWGDPQKHAPRLAASLARFVRWRPSTRVEIFGAGGEAALGALAGGGQITLRGVQRQEVVAEAMSRARAIVFASRWETFPPHAACEALALGATLVAPPIPAFRSWTADGRFGTLARRRGARALAAALAAEMAAWDGGARDGRRIASHWRERLRPEVVCGRLLAPLA